MWWLYSRRARVFQKRGLSAIERAETVRVGVGGTED